MTSPCSMQLLEKRQKQESMENCLDKIGNGREPMENARRQ